MTGVWKFLYARRSPGGRRSDTPEDPDLRRLPRHRRDPLPRVRNLCRSTSRMEHESVLLVDRRSTVNLENNNRNTQLPEAVIQARQRLVERLRNATLIEPRRDETLRYLLNSNVEIEKKPCETLSTTLHVENFRNSEEIGEMEAGAQESCICLESFFEGVELSRLHCGHRFHPTCLEPWLRTCSHCPYCRARIS